MAYGDVIAFALQPGIVAVMPQTTAFALPSKTPVMIQSSAALELSIDGVTFTSVTATTTGTTTVAGFARCTTGTVTVLAKVY
jgi:hypothetical protein